MTAERRAALLLLGLAALGQGVRAWLSAPDGPPGEVRLGGSAPGTSPSPLRHKDSALALARPLRADERIDLDRAGPVEIARLPRIGLSLAKAIVADRESRGPFGSLQALDRVRGVGPGLLRVIEPHATFSATVAPAEVPERGWPVRPLGLNSASQAELEHLPYIGPELARRIVLWRSRHGPFPAVDSLVRVPGVGPSTVARLRDRLAID